MLRHSIGAAICCAFLASGALALSDTSPCTQDHVAVAGDWGTAEFRVEIADDSAERAQGLMWRETMPRWSGMLFLYEAPQRLTFWMRNTLIPLDMIFIDPTGRISHVHSSAIPLDETPIDGGPGNIAVLEINGGLAETLGIQVGDTIRHPGLDQALAIWPCPDS